MNPEINNRKESFNYKEEIQAVLDFIENKVLIDSNPFANDENFRYQLDLFKTDIKFRLIAVLKMQEYVSSETPQAIFQINGDDPLSIFNLSQYHTDLYAQKFFPKEGLEIGVQKGLAFVVHDILNKDIRRDSREAEFLYLDPEIQPDIHSALVAKNLLENHDGNYIGKRFNYNEIISTLDV